MLIGGCTRLPKERQLFPVANARHELNVQEMGETKDWRVLSLGICMEDIRLDIRGILEQPVENIDGFPHATRDKVVSGILYVCFL
jgi:hypothetical protein